MVGHTAWNMIILANLCEARSVAVALADNIVSEDDIDWDFCNCWLVSLQERNWEA